ncbi:AMP-binding protein [Pseudomonas sp. NPDC096950]|uniref:AMP-binding protein n=1 Tax=Pseudomonas sp. NPDC096950 TaxID=3364485 RepID=UPI00383B0176
MNTILTALARTAELSPGRGFHVLKNGKVSSFLSHAELYKSAQARASVMRGHVTLNERVGLIFFNELSFIESFFAILLAGGVPVPIAPPQPFSPLQGFYRRVGLIARQSMIHRFLVSESVSEEVRESLGVHSSSIVQTLDEFSALSESAAAVPLERPNAISDTALIQYTSGSTSDPKGVVVTQENLILNVAAMCESFEMNAESAGVTWLPFFHDMGLIGGLLLPVFAGSDSYIMRTADFVKAPLGWLKAISDFSLKISPAPNFAYKYCLERFKTDALSGLDLTTWRSATSGAEPINPKVMRAFTQAFAPYGFTANSIMPLYGMAEATLGATFTAVGEGMRSVFVDRDALNNGLVVLADSDASGNKEIVSCGKPIRHVEVSIRVDNSHFVDTPLLLGEIALKGNSVCCAYDNDPKNTAAMLENGWFLTGDIGFLFEQNLYVVGRSKEVIIINGANYFANDIESYTAEVEGVRGVAAVPLIGSDSEECALLIVPAKGHDPSSLTQIIRRKISDELGIYISSIDIIAAGQLFKTTSGKIDRAKMKSLYNDNFSRSIEAVNP